MAEVQNILPLTTCDYFSVFLWLALSRFTRATQRHKHKPKHKKKERFPFLMLEFMLVLPWFTRWFLVLIRLLMLMFMLTLAW